MRACFVKGPTQRKEPSDLASQFLFEKTNACYVMATSISTGKMQDVYLLNDCIFTQYMLFHVQNMSMLESYMGTTVHVIDACEPIWDQISHMAVLACDMPCDVPDHVQVIQLTEQEITEMKPSTKQKIKAWAALQDNPKIV